MNFVLALWQISPPKNPAFAYHTLYIYSLEWLLLNILILCRKLDHATQEEDSAANPQHCSRCGQEAKPQQLCRCKPGGPSEEIWRNRAGWAEVVPGSFLFIHTESQSGQAEGQWLLEDLWTGSWQWQCGHHKPSGFIASATAFPIQVYTFMWDIVKTNSHRLLLQSRSKSMPKLTLGKRPASSFILV